MKIFFDQLQHDIKYGRHSESVNLLSQSRHLAEKAPEDRPKLNDTGWGGTGMLTKLFNQISVVDCLGRTCSFCVLFPFVQGTASLRNQRQRNIILRIPKLAKCDWSYGGFWKRQ